MISPVSYTVLLWLIEGFLLVSIQVILFSSSDEESLLLGFLASFATTYITAPFRVFFMHAPLVALAAFYFKPQVRFSTSITFGILNSISMLLCVWMASLIVPFFGNLLTWETPLSDNIVYLSMFCGLLSPVVAWRILHRKISHANFF